MVAFASALYCIGLGFVRTELLQRVGMSERDRNPNEREQSMQDIVTSWKADYHL
jgi:hypothetical protein